MNVFQRLGAGVARAALTATGLPKAGPVRPGSPAEAAEFDAAAERLLGAGGARVDTADLPAPIFPFLCWLAENRPVLFHGSSRDDIDELRPIRLSRDSSAFGDQQAVYATNDPIWAAWFAVVARDAAMRGMRNASIGLAPVGRVFPRWYFFSVNRTDGTPAFAPGTLYLLPSEGFAPERRDLGVADTGQLVCPSAVRPLTSIAVEPADVPFVDCTVTHQQGESQLRTMARFGRSHRRRRTRPPA